MAPRRRGGTATATAPAESWAQDGELCAPPQTLPVPLGARERGQAPADTAREEAEMPGRPRRAPEGNDRDPSEAPRPSPAGGRCPAATGRERAAGPGGRGRWRHRIPSSFPPSLPAGRCAPEPLRTAAAFRSPRRPEARGRERERDRVGAGEGETRALPGGCCDGGAGDLRAAQEDRGAHRVADQRRVRHPVSK